MFCLSLGSQRVCVLCPSHAQRSFFFLLSRFLHRSNQELFLTSCLTKSQRSLSDLGNPSDCRVSTCNNCKARKASRGVPGASENSKWQRLLCADCASASGIENTAALQRRCSECHRVSQCALRFVLWEVNYLCMYAHSWCLSLHTGRRKLWAPRYV